jgi:GNAT superfamily N-acetyltransferase
MPEVMVRDARSEDAPAIAGIWAATMPQLVRSAARAAADLTQDAALGRRRWVGVLDGHVVGTATGRRTDHTQVFFGIEVRPESGSRGVGTALLLAVTEAFPESTEMTSVCSENPISLAFAVRNGFLPVGEHRLSSVDPGSVPPVGPAPAGLVALTLDRLDDLDLLLETHNLAAADDPSGLSRVYDRETFLAEWWTSPDNASELSWALLDTSGSAPVVTAFTSVQLDRQRHRASSAMTATHPSYRGRGLARWVKQRMLNAAAEAGVTEATTANDASNAAMLAVNDALGYRPVSRTIRVQRRLPD